GGFVADARRVARRTLRAVAELDAVVVPSGSCAAMMRLHWTQLFAGDRDAALAARVGPRVFELSQYLVEELGAPPIGSHTGRAVADQHELPRSDRCCGFGGAFAVRYPDVSTAMADDKLATAQAAGAETVVSADPGC